MSGPILDVHGETKPTARGWIHLGAVPVALVLGVVLIVLADGAAAKTASTVYAITSVILFGVSAVYHRGRWSPPAARRLRRLDHANIFLLIAGTYTPLAVCGLDRPDRTVLLTIIWVGAALGIASRLIWLGAPRWLYVVLYIVLGFTAFAFIGPLFADHPTSMTLVLIGGAAYVIGAVCYATKRPNPWPGRFGFHEVFHLCTVVAFLLQWVGILLIALHPSP